ncbi:MAG TPA: mercuric transporter MerT family protein [Blastocatellia bacterium]|nr:mercuric transporter MerT family protein [Blastocatellia bacterium]
MKSLKVSRTSVTNGVSLLSAVFSFLPLTCCVFPVAFSFLGATGLAFAEAMTPYRPYFIGLTVVSLGFGFYFTYRASGECAPDSACALPRSRKIQRASLWVVTLLVAALLIFPYLVPYLPAWMLG